MLLITRMTDMCCGLTQ